MLKKSCLRSSVLLLTVGGGLCMACPPARAAGMAGMTMDQQASGSVSLDPREGSGTSWQPAASPMRGIAGRADGWLWMLHGRAQGGFNYQDSLRGGEGDAAENWIMGMGAHALGRGTLELLSMFSLEPLTIPGSGEPQLFQEGETWMLAPLMDHQHPHNFFMELAAMYTVPIAPHLSFLSYAAPVGEPALGPEAFMHRPSAGENPWAPLGHHLEDSTHISMGVLTEGLIYRDWKLDASIFNGREPGENKWLITEGPLDSYSGRLTWNPSPDWSMQVSAGHLTAPEYIVPNDVVRTTASVSYDRPFPRGNFAATLLWGHNHELISPPLDFNGYLLEGALDLDKVNHFYGRAEVDDHSLLRPIDYFPPAGGYNPLGYHVLHVPGAGEQTVGALTLGGVRDLWSNRWVVIGLGGDATLNVVPPSLLSSYGEPFPPAFEVYARVTMPLMSMGS